MGAQLAFATAAPAATRIPVGARVRCAYRTSTGGLQPWLSFDHRGTVLALDDPRCWRGSIRFPAEPTQAECTAHVEWCLAQGLLCGRQPVLWDFGKIYWDRHLEAV